MSPCHARTLRRPAGLPVLILLLGLIAVPRITRGQAGDVTGIVPEVRNSATPAEGRTEVALRELWRLGAQGTDPEAIGLVSAAFLDHDGNVCLLDSDHGELRVYDAAGKRVRTIKPGGDPAAVLHGVSGACALEPDGYGLLQAYPPVVLRLGTDGTPAGTLVPRLSDAAPPESARSMISLVGARAQGEVLVLDCLLEMSIPRHHRLHRTHFIGVFGPNGYESRRLLSAEEDTPLGDSVSFAEREIVHYQGRWTTGPDGLIYAAPELYRYAIQVLTPTGGLRRIISRPYTSVPRTPKEHARVQHLFDAFARGMPRARVSVESTHADIQDLMLAGDGSLWVLSSEGRFRAPPGLLGVYDVFDPKGRFARQVALKGEGDPVQDGIWLLGDRVIVVRHMQAAALARLEGGAASKTPGVTVICYAR